MRVTNPKELPSKPGVYVLYSGDKCLYVGSSANVRKRLYSHQHKGKFDSAEFFPCKIRDLGETEERFISELRPMLNRQMKPRRTRQPHAYMRTMVAIRFTAEEKRKLEYCCTEECRPLGNMIRVLISEAMEHREAGKNKEAA